MKKFIPFLAFVLSLVATACTQDATAPATDAGTTKQKVYLVTFVSDQPMPSISNTFVTFGSTYDFNDVFLGMQEQIAYDANGIPLPMGAIVKTGESISVALIVNTSPWVASQNGAKPLYQFVSDWHGVSADPTAITQTGPDKFSFYAMRYDKNYNYLGSRTYELTASGNKIIAPLSLPADDTIRAIFPRQIKSFTCNGDGSMSIYSSDGVNYIVDKMERVQLQLGMRVPPNTLKCSEYSTEAAAKESLGSLMVARLTANFVKPALRFVGPRPFIK